MIWEASFGEPFLQFNILGEEAECEMNYSVYKKIIKRVCMYNNNVSCPHVYLRTFLCNTICRGGNTQEQNWP